MTLKALVTGGTGFVGANLVRRLLNDGFEVHLLLRESFREWRIKNILNDVHTHILDFRDADKLELTISNIKPDYVFHLAVYGGYSDQEMVSHMLDTNVIGSVNFLNACLKVGFAAFINTGSSSEYGFKDHSPAEDEYLEPNSQYAVTKAFMTHFCRYAAKKHNANISTLRLYSVYGPYEEPTRLIPTLLIKGLQKKLPALVDPKIARDYVYIDEVCDFYMKAMHYSGDEKGPVFNVGTGLQTELSEVVNVVKDVLCVDEAPRWGTMENRHWDSTCWVGKIDKARKLGWNPETKFRDGFNRFVEWYTSQPQWLKEMYMEKVQ